MSEIFGILLWSSNPFKDTAGQLLMMLYTTISTLVCIKILRIVKLKQSRAID